MAAALLDLRSGVRSRSARRVAQRCGNQPCRRRRDGGDRRGPDGRDAEVADRDSRSRVVPPDSPLAVATALPLGTRSAPVVWPCVGCDPDDLTAVVEASGLHESPDHQETGSCSLAKRDERHHGQASYDHRHERAKLGLQRAEISVEALSLGGDLSADLPGASLLRHGSAVSRPCALPPLAPATASGAKPCGQIASPGTRRSPRGGREFPQR